MSARLVVVDREPIDYKELRASVDLRLVVAPSALIRGDKPAKVTCLWHDDSTPSLMVYKSHMHCFGCGVHMDLVDFVAWKEGLDTSKDYERLVEIIQRDFAGTAAKVSVKVNPKKLRPIAGSVAEYYHQRLLGKRDWFKVRGLSDETIDREKLGYEVRAFVIPVWSRRGDLLTLRFRRDESLEGSGSKYWGMEGRNDVYLYNEKALEVADVWDFVVICEGELDALRLYQEGLPAISSTNGVEAFNDSLAKVVKSYDPKRVIVAYDQDMPGKIHGIRVARMFGLRGRVASWPLAWGKDVTNVLEKLPVERLTRRLLVADTPVAVERFWQKTLRRAR